MGGILDAQSVYSKEQSQKRWEVVPGRNQGNSQLDSGESPPPLPTVSHRWALPLTSGVKSNTCFFSEGGCQTLCHQALHPMGGWLAAVERPEHKINNHVHLIQVGFQLMQSLL